MLSDCFRGTIVVLLGVSSSVAMGKTANMACTSSALLDLQPTREGADVGGVEDSAGKDSSLHGRSINKVRFFEALDDVRPVKCIVVQEACRMGAAGGTRTGPRGEFAYGRKLLMKCSSTNAARPRIMPFVASRLCLPPSFPSTAPLRPRILPLSFIITVSWFFTIHVVPEPFTHRS